MKTHHKSGPKDLWPLKLVTIENTNPNIHCNSSIERDSICNSCDGFGKLQSQTLELQTLWDCLHFFAPFHIAEASRAQFYEKAAGSKAAREGPASATSSQILPRKEHLRKIFFNKISEIETGNSFLEKTRWRKSSTSSQIINIWYCQENMCN